MRVVEEMVFAPGASQFNRVRRSLTAAILLGLLLVPATCSHAAGPHSLFIDPRDESPQAAAHPHHPGDQAEEPVAATGQPGNRPSAHDLPSSLLVSLAASAIHLDIPQLLAIPATQLPESLRAIPVPAGVAAVVDVPPPRLTQR